MVWSNGRYYVGNFEKDEQHGFGTGFNSDKTLFHHGLWRHGSPIKK